MRARAFRLVTRHDRRCLESRWQLYGGYETADRLGDIHGKGPFFCWLIAKCIGCKKAEALVRADKLAFAVNILEDR